MKQRFKFFGALMYNAPYRPGPPDCAVVLENDMNTWADTLPSGTRIRRTQLAASEECVIVLVNYEVNEGEDV